MAIPKEKKLLVACADRMVFEVDRTTLEAKSTSRYDAFIFTDPPKDAEVISNGEWCRRRWAIDQAARSVGRAALSAKETAEKNFGKEVVGRFKAALPLEGER